MMPTEREQAAYERARAIAWECTRAGLRGDPMPEVAAEYFGHFARHYEAGKAIGARSDWPPAHPDA